jgi:hypothetical protein
MPTNLPDPRKPKPQKLEETTLNVLFLLGAVVMAVACVIIIWSLFFANG